MAISAQTSFAACLKKTEIKPEEVDVGFNYGALVSGDVAAQWAFTVTAGIDLPAKGTPINIISPADYGITTDGYTILRGTTLFEIALSW